jgi:hypothetical protein
MNNTAGVYPGQTVSQPTRSAPLHEKESKEHQGIIMERTLHVNITNSLGNLALAGPMGGVWKPVDGSQLKLFSHVEGESFDTSTATNQLSSAIIHECTLLEHQSTFPIPLGVQINCIPAREVTELGEKFSYTVLPYSNISTPHMIYKTEHLGSDMYEWHKEFPNYNSHNLETEGVLPVNNQSIVFIDQCHPVTALLRANQHLIGCDIDSQKKMNDQYFKISRQVLQTCCQTLRQKVLSKITTHDLNTLSVQIHRINAESWEDMGDGSIAMKNFKIKAGVAPEIEEEAKRKHLRAFTSTPYSYTARIKLKYELPNKA